MTEKRDWSAARDWQAESHTRAVADSQQLELLMRSILKLFADGCLVYRHRTRRTNGVQTKSERLRRLRGGLVSTPLAPGAGGPAAVA